MNSVVDSNCTAKDSTINDCTINYCLRNVTPAQRRLLRSAPHEVIEDFCLQRCGDCEQGPMLVVNGELIAGSDHATLLNQLDRSAQPAAKEEDRS